MHRPLPFTRLALVFFAAATFLWSGCDKGVELDESGELLIEDLKAGTGETAAAGKRLQVHATGSVRGGDTFHNTRTAYPLVFTLGANQVIQGFEQGLPGMKVGGVRKLTIPPRLAFGTSAFQGVPANSTVVFEVELLRADHPDSLAIEDMKQGQGRLSAAGDTLQAHYVGYFGNGQIFDASTNRGPITFVLGKGNVIEGWDKGLLNMREGGTRRIIVPPALGYGTRGQGAIPPNTTLVFEVQLLQVRKG